MQKLIIKDEKKAITVTNIDADDHRDFKVSCSLNNTTISDAIRNFIREYGQAFRNLKRR